MSNDLWLRQEQGGDGPNDIRLYLEGPDAGGPSTLTLDPTTGAITVAGAAPGLSFTLAPSTGAVTVTGGTPALQLTLAPTAGGVLVQGNAPDLAFALLLTPGTGAIGIAGNAPTVALVVPSVGTGVGGNIVSRGLGKAGHGTLVAWGLGRRPIPVTQVAPSRWNRRNQVPNWAHWYDYQRQAVQTAEAVPRQAVAKEVRKPETVVVYRTVGELEIAAIRQEAEVVREQVRAVVQKALQAPRRSEQEDEEDVLTLLALMQ